MAIKVNLDMRGVIGDIRAYSQDVQNELKKAVQITAINIQRVAKIKCPVDTGRLRASINMEFAADGLNARVGTNVKYAKFVHWGTGRRGSSSNLNPPSEYSYGQRAGMAGRPFLFSASEEERPAFIARVRRIKGV
jgi:HK97 gp10 family phage protein